MGFPWGVYGVIQRHTYGKHKETKKETPKGIPRGLS